MTITRVRAHLARPMTPTALFGAGLLLTGLAATAYILTAETAVYWPETVHRLAINAITVGVLLTVYASLRRKGRSIEEAYRLGYDLGYENGHRAGLETFAAAQVADPSKREHPSVPDLTPQRR